jgi:hypothetical protein
MLSVNALNKLIIKNSLRVGLPLLLALGACTKTNDAATHIGGQTDKEVKTLELKSAWKTPCTKANTLFEMFGIPSQSIVLDFGASHSSTTTLFREDNCQVPAITIAENGNFTVGDKVADNVYDLNEHYDSVAITPVNDDGMNALNTAHACGFTDWKTGQARDVTAQSSTTPVISRCWIKTPRDIFDIVMITGDQIKLGLEKDGKDKTSPDKRPSEIDQSAVLSK